MRIGEPNGENSYRWWLGICLDTASWGISTKW